MKALVGTFNKALVEAYCVIARLRLREGSFPAVAAAVCGV